MAKRFSDTGKYRDPWHRSLNPIFKCFWDFICLECDQAGFWKKDYDQAFFSIGQRFKEIEMLEAINSGKERIRNHGEYLEVIDFIGFQYGTLSNECKAHIPIFKLIQKHQSKGYAKGIHTLKEKEIEKEIKDRGVGEGENTENQTAELTGGQKTCESRAELAKREKMFDELWRNYPSKVGMKHAKRHYLATVKTQEDHGRISLALSNYLRSKRVQEGFIQNGSTWFNNWTDWVDFKEPSKQDDYESLKEKVYGKSN